MSTLGRIPVKITVYGNHNTRRYITVLYRACECFSFVTVAGFYVEVMDDQANTL